MEDFIIYPDDKTMEKLAAEYAKIKAKTFTSTAEILEENEPVTTVSPYRRNTLPPYFLVTLISAAILKSIKSK